MMLMLLGPKCGPFQMIGSDPPDELHGCHTLGLTGCLTLNRLGSGNGKHGE